MNSHDEHSHGCSRKLGSVWVPADPECSECQAIARGANAISSDWPDNVSALAEKCRYCPAWILWTRTTTQAWMPVDRDPVPDGDVLVTRSPIELRSHVLTKVELLHVDREKTPLRKSHFASCPGADEARRARGQTSPPVRTTTTLPATTPDTL